MILFLSLSPCFFLSQFNFRLLWYEQFSNALLSFKRVHRLFIIDGSKFGVKFMAYFKVNDIGISNYDWRKSIIKFQFWGKTGTSAVPVCIHCVTLLLIMSGYKRWTMSDNGKRNLFSIRDDWRTRLFQWILFFGFLKTVSNTSDLIKYGFSKQKKHRYYNAYVHLAYEKA